MAPFQFFSDPNKFVLFLVALYIAAYAAVLVKGWRVGDRRAAQRAALYGVALEFHAQELIDLINRVLDEEPRILMPVKKHWILFVVSIFVTASALFATFFDPFTKIYPPISPYGPALFTFFFLFCATGLLLIALQYKYLIAIERFRDQHVQSGSKKVTLGVE